MMHPVSITATKCNPFKWRGPHYNHNPNVRLTDAVQYPHPKSLVCWQKKNRHSGGSSIAFQRAAGPLSMWTSPKEYVCTPALIIGRQTNWICRVSTRCALWGHGLTGSRTHTVHMNLLTSVACYRVYSTASKHVLPYTQWCFFLMSSDCFYIWFTLVG